MRSINWLTFSYFSSELNYGCVLDSDCKIDGVPDAVCSKNLKCEDPKSTKTFESDTIHRSESIDSSIGRIKLDDACSNDDDCKSLGEAECSKQKHCICKTGYYPNANNGLCLAGLYDKIILCAVLIKWTVMICDICWQI